MSGFGFSSMIYPEFPWKSIPGVMVIVAGTAWFPHSFLPCGRSDLSLRMHCAISKQNISCMNTVIDAHNISKTFNPETIPVVAVNNVDLHMERGEFTALVGPSGSGRQHCSTSSAGLTDPIPVRLSSMALT